jgi:CDP-glucose 4,6-dehydratase
VQAARRDPAATFAANVAGTWQLLDACRLLSSRPRAIAVASSDKAYGKSERLPYVETDPLAGSEPYEASKAMTDILAQTYAVSYGLPTRIARCGNVYGTGDLNLDRIIPGTLRALLRGERPIIRSDGTPIRDYVHVDDVVDAYLSLGSRHISPGAAFNFSSGERLSVLELVGLIQRAARSDLAPDVRSEAVGELAEQFLDSSKAERELAWHPSRRLAASLPEITEWYRTVA